jgi:hypothetical protein
MSEREPVTTRGAGGPAGSASTSFWRSHAFALLLTVLGGLVVAVPWWHNHDHLSDLMDYGLVMAANGRIADGQRPYTDFVTPIQSGFLGMNYLAERLGGGTYLGLTRSAVAVMLACFGVLAFLASRRLPIGIGVGLAAVVTIGSMGQHTILWHNSVGVICAALALWVAALKPVWRGTDWAWHALMLGALWVGGMNKLSYHLVTVAGVLALALRAVLLKRDDWPNALKLMGGVMLGGLVLPLSTELIWTGSTFETWRYNVIELAASGRAVHLIALGQVDKYLAPLHDYYGALRLPQIGLMSVVVAMLLVVWGWPRRGWLDRIMLIVAAAMVPGVTMALLVTNLEIAYVAGAGGIAIAGAIVLGFRFDSQLRIPLALWSVPVVWFGLAAWADAWDGKRSIYGDRTAPRETYRELAGGQEHYDYLAGVNVPPEVADSYEQLGKHLPFVAEGEALNVFYGPGVEWLERVWPTRSVPELPLWLHDETSYSPRENQILAAALSPPAAFDLVVVSTPRDSWPDSVYLPINLFTRPEAVGAALTVRRASNSLNREHDDLHLINLLGVNFMPHLLRFGADLTLAQTEDDRIMFGRAGTGSTHLFYDGRVNRLTGEMVLLRRGADQSQVATSARYEVHYEAGGKWHHLASHEVELMSGVPQVIVPFEIDGRQRPLRFTVKTAENIPPEVVAGWHAPRMHNSIPDDEEPPRLFAASAATTETESGLVNALVVGDWRPNDVLSRGGTPNDRGVELQPGDQLWLKVLEPLRALDGWVEVAADADDAMPHFTALWYQGGRVEIAAQFEISREHRHRRFHTWTPGVGGWIGFIVRPGVDTAALTLKIDHIERSD